MLSSRNEGPADAGPSFFNRNNVLEVLTQSYNL